MLVTHVHLSFLMVNALFVVEIVIAIVIVQMALYALSEVRALMYQVVPGEQMVPLSKLQMMTTVSSNENTILYCRDE